MPGPRIRQEIPSGVLGKATEGDGWERGLGREKKRRLERKKDI
jgi:hypothetical protein